jgi:hypothetical protein
LFRASWFAEDNIKKYLEDIYFTWVLPFDASKTDDLDREAAHGKHEKNEPNTFEHPYAYSSFFL